MIHLDKEVLSNVVQISLATRRASNFGGGGGRGRGRGGFRGRGKYRSKFFIVSTIFICFQEVVVEVAAVIMVVIVAEVSVFLQVFMIKLNFFR